MESREFLRFLFSGVKEVLNQSDLLFVSSLVKVWHSFFDFGFVFFLHAGSVPWTSLMCSRKALSASGISASYCSIEVSVSSLRMANSLSAQNCNAYL